MKNSKMLIGIVVVVILVVVGVVIFTGSRGKSTTQTPSAQEEMAAETISPAELGLTLTARPDKKAVKFAIANSDGITHVEYYISYQRTDTSSEGEGDISEALYGEVDVIPGEPIETEYRDLGTCSSGVCRYHTVTSPVKLTLKITKDNGKVYQSEENLEL